MINNKDITIILMITGLALLSGCGNQPGDEELSTSEITTEEIGDSHSGEEAFIPIEERERTFKGKDVFVDKATGYEYIVAELEPGNPSLLSMAEKYLGDKEKWPVIVAYNNILDPTDVPDGTPLRIPIRKTPRNARLTIIHNDVLAKRTVDLDWLGARLNMKLSIGDGVRTLDDSSATITFDRASELNVSENSMVFIADLSASEPSVPKRSQLNLESGKLNITRNGGSVGEIVEIKTGEAIVNPEVEPGEFLDFRTKVTEDDDTLVMSYSGDIAVSARGESVDLTSGEGSEVKKGRKPSEPEPLLPAPGVKTGPSEYYYGNPTLIWDKVSGVKDYVVEIAFDAAFTKIYKIFTSVESTEITRDFRKGRYYWRICAVDAKGFEGYWSDVSSFVILREGRDEEPPVTTIEYIGGEPSEVNGEKYLHPKTGIRLVANDDLSGVNAIDISIDGKPEKPYSGNTLRLSGGPHEITYYAVDRSNKKEKVKGLSYTVDDKQPVITFTEKP